ncbi:hypothetical protein LPB72_17450 [Hydrogenophaga crassostreae]|uniref:Uncharacterized protein n=1 Tax=Hydrogenophaga crassostreae TaxID=1763535 RepID=A0A167GWR0_9BURK|nr:hypothetical protein [Hydrogenophaga crassostreae]AOW12785.1 hypothetical protein LPB072_07955 [Hydrogenophaga crassostreae]OAD39973.1 hypothetical protein LPB72_17450 [Hydrogenophaga crassostreae]
MSFKSLGFGSTFVRFKLLISIASLALLTACGGGDPDIPNIGGGSSGGKWGVNFRSFSAGFSALAAPTSSSPQSFTVSWKADRTGGNPAYLLYAYLVPASMGNASPPDNLLFLGATCGPNITGCDASGAQQCAYLADSSGGGRTIDCGSPRSAGTRLSRQPGSYLVIAKACYISETLDEICQSKPGIPVTLN